MFFIKEIEGSVFIGIEESITFKSKYHILKKLNDELVNIYVKYSDNIQDDSEVLCKQYAFTITSQETEKNDLYKININTVVFSSYNEAISYLEGLINSLIKEISQLNDYNNTDNITSFEEKDSDDILDIIK